MTSAGRSCCRPAIHGRHRVVRVMVKPQPRAVACAGWFQRRVSPDPAPPPRFQPDVVVGAVGVIVTIVATVLMAIADLKTDLKVGVVAFPIWAVLVSLRALIKTPLHLGGHHLPQDGPQDGYQGAVRQAGQRGE